ELRSELEVPVARPVRDHADDLGEVCLGVEPVQLGRGDQGEEVRGGVRVVVRAEKQPRLPSDGDLTQGALRGVVFEAKAPIVEEPTERLALACRVPKRRRDGATYVADARIDAVGPGEEVVDDRARRPLSPIMSLLRREVGPGLFELEERTNAEERLA